MGGGTLPLFLAHHFPGLTVRPELVSLSNRNPALRMGC